MRPIIALLLAVLLSSPANAQDNDTLFLLGKTWGYLKYHHPQVRRGCFDWDAKLLGILEDIEDANARDATSLVEEWVQSLDDEPESCQNDESKEVHFANSREWIRDEGLLGRKLSQMLQETAVSQVPNSPQFYVSLQAGVGNPQFFAERAYADLEFPDSNYRLLALFRFWNIIEYWFPYRDIIDRDWDDVLREFIPRFVAAGSNEQYILELMALIASVQDTHANLWSSMEYRPPGGALQVPAQVRIVEGKPFVWRVFDDESAPLLYGDLIVAVDGRPVAQLFDEWRPYYGFSNEITFLRDASRGLLKGRSAEGVVTVQRGGAQIDVPVRRVNPGDWRPTHDRDGETLQFLTDNIAYLKLSSVENNGGKGYAESASGSSGLIVDIRNYPSAFMVFSLGQHLVSEPTEFARFTRADLSHPGTFTWSDPVSLSPKAPHYTGKVVILVDERSQSSSEYTAMALGSAPNATVIGSQTAGADGNISAIDLPGGHRTVISGIGVFYPDKTPTQKIGIVPDIEVTPTIEGLHDGRDEVLEVAVRDILGDTISEEELRRITRIPHAPIIEE